MSKMQLDKEDDQVCSRREVQGYVKEFTRHSNDVLFNLNELRHRNILTDATLLVGSARLHAHCAVLIACSGFFYSLFSRHKTSAVGEQGVSLSLPEGLDAGSVALLLDFMYTSRLPLSPGTVPGVLAAATYLQMEHVADTCRAFLQKSEKAYISPDLVDLALRNTNGSFRASPGGRSPAAHPSFTFSPVRPVVDMEEPCPAQARFPQENLASVESVTCQSLSPKTPSPGSPCQSRGQPNSPAESSGCSVFPKLKLHSESRPTPDPKACNWKKYKYIILNPLCSTSIKEEEDGPGEEMDNFNHSSSTSDTANVTPKLSDESWSTAGRELIEIQSPFMAYQRLSTHTADNHKGHRPAPAQDNRDLCSLHQCPCPSVINGKTNIRPFGKLPVKVENQSPVICYSGNQGTAKPTCSAEKPYQCTVCGAQFNRPANLKTHSRIHSGEKPYRCDTCGARFVQVAHLRAHVLIHTGEKPYPCHTCGTRFRHLQTLKSHLRIHTGEKPYQCEKCDLRFRHKSQLRLHLRQKHGAVTNTKIHYKVLTDPYQTGPAILQAS